MIKITYTEVLERQQQLGCFISELHTCSSIATTYWLCHVREELQEMEESPSMEELADVLIFYQNMIFCCRFELETFELDLRAHSKEWPTLEQIAWNRKHWKKYSQPTTTAIYAWFRNLYFQYYDEDQILDFEQTYESKMRYNETRTDWDLLR
jgi:hypothetical protein